MPVYVSLLSIPDETKDNKISTLVSQILAMKYNNPKTEVSDLESQIDQLVYELYGLAPEEIAVVEGVNKE